MGNEVSDAKTYNRDLYNALYRSMKRDDTKWLAKVDGKYDLLDLKIIHEKCPVYWSHFEPLYMRGNAYILTDNEHVTIRTKSLDKLLRTTRKVNIFLKVTPIQIAKLNDLLSKEYSPHVLEYLST